LGKLTIIASAATRGIWRGLTRPKPRPTWNRRNAVYVEIVRDVLRQAMPQDGPSQQRILAPPKEKPPRDLEFRELTLAGLPAIELRKAQTTDRTFLHFHGGGYVIGSALGAVPYLGRMARKSGARVVSVDYRLAPQHPYPAAIDDALAAVRAILDEGTAPENLVIGGDSAGGGLSLATLVRLRDEGGPKLGGAVLGSPWMELRVSRDSIDSNADADYLPKGMADVWARMYAGNADLDEPLLSPGRADLSGLPKLMIIAGEAEMIRDQITAGAEAARAAGVDVELMIGKDAVHCWYMQPGLFPGPDVTEQIAAFIAGS